MITGYFWPAIEKHDSGYMWFQKDGTTCHATVMNMTLLRMKFPVRVISRLGYVSSPLKTNIRLIMAGHIAQCMPKSSRKLPQTGRSLQ